MILNLPQILKTQRPKIRKFKPLKTSLRTERWYREELLSLVKGLRKVVEQAVENPDNFVIHDSQDGNNKVRQDLSQIIRRLIERKIDDTAQRIAQGFVQRGNQQNLSEQTTLFKQATGIDLGDMLRASPKVAEKLNIATEANVALIKSIRSQYLDKVQTAVSQAVMRGALNKDLAAEIQKIGNVTESRAKLIARDQTSKFNAALSRARHEDAGATKYRWSTSGDERVRDSHAANDGKVFAYADPPATDNPGDEVNCRCVAIPIFDENVKTEKELEREREKAVEKVEPVEPPKSKPVPEPKPVETEAEIKAKAIEAYYGKMKAKDLISELGGKYNFETVNKSVNRNTAKWKALGLNKAEANYVASYTYSAIYRDLNENLRLGQATPAQREYAKRLDATLEKLPKFEGKSYRDLNIVEENLNALLERYKIGTVVEEEQFFSSSHNEHFHGFAGNVRFVITGKTGRNIETVSYADNENEVLFQTKRKFKVKDSFDNENGVRIIELIEVE